MAPLTASSFLPCIILLIAMAQVAHATARAGSFAVASHTYIDYAEPTRSRILQQQMHRSASDWKEFLISDGLANRRLLQNGQAPYTAPGNRPSPQSASPAPQSPSPSPSSPSPSSPSPSNPTSPSSNPSSPSPSSSPSPPNNGNRAAQDRADAQTRAQQAQQEADAKASQQSQGQGSSVAAQNMAKAQAQQAQAQSQAQSQAQQQS